MSIFTASNEVKVIPHDTSIGVRLSVRDEYPVNVPGYGPSRESVETYLDPRQVDALREFFDFASAERWQTKRDAEIGRWRWPENPDFVVYAEDDGVHNVVNEKTGLSLMATRGGVKRHDDQHADAARAYFEAHPERKPWEEAKDGEVWLLTYEGQEYAFGFDSRDERFIYASGESWFPHTDPAITAGRRIWPEDAS